MYKTVNTSSYGNILSELKVADTFKQSVKSEYANKLVFLPPIDQQAAMIKAVEALRHGFDKSDSSTIETYLPHG